METVRRGDFWQLIFWQCRLHHRTADARVGEGAKCDRGERPAPLAANRLRLPALGEVMREQFLIPLKMFGQRLACLELEPAYPSEQWHYRRCCAWARQGARYNGAALAQSAGLCRLDLVMAPSLTACDRSRPAPEGHPADTRRPIFEPFIRKQRVHRKGCTGPFWLMTDGCFNNNYPAAHLSRYRC